LEPISSALFALSGAAPSFACVPPEDLATELTLRGLPPFAYDNWSPLRSFAVWLFVLEDPAQLLGVCRLLELANLPTKASERSADMPILLMTGPAVDGLDLARVFADRILTTAAAETAATVHDLLSHANPRLALESVAGEPAIEMAFEMPSSTELAPHPENPERRSNFLLPIHRAALRGDAVGWATDVAGHPRRLLQPWAATAELQRELGVFNASETVWSAVDALAAEEDLTVLLRFAVGAAGETEADRAAIVDWVAEALRRSRLEPGRVTVQLLPFIDDAPLAASPGRLGESMDRIQTRLRKMRCRVETGEPIAAWRGGILRRLGAEGASLLFEMLRRGARAAESPLACDADLWHKALQAVNLDGHSPEWTEPEPLRAAGSSCPESSDRTTHAPLDQRRDSAVSSESKGSANSAVCGEAMPEAKSSRPKPRPDRWRRWADLAPRHFDYRLEYSKRGRWRHLSQRELGELFLDICRRAEVPLATTGVAQRRARISFGPSLQVGVEGLREYIDLSLTHKHPQLDSALRPWLPQELELLSVQFRPAGSVRIGLGEIRRAEYEAAIPLDEETGVSLEALHQRRDDLEQMARRARLRIAAGSKAKPDAIHQLVRIEIVEHPADDSQALLSFTLDLDCEGKKLRVMELIDRFLKDLVDEPHLLPIRRTRLLANSSDGNDWITPSEQIERHRREFRARAKRCA
jgi:radical SAM-linked protein